MKARKFPFLALMAILVLGCVATRPVATEAGRAKTDDLKARIDAAVKDRRNWVDPDRGFW